MASRKSSITAELKLAGKAQFKSGLNEAGRDARVFGKSLESLGGKGIGSSMRLTELHSGLQLAGSAARIAGSAFKSAFSKDLNVEQLAMALSSVSDGTETLADQFAALKEAAKLPGLGFTEIAKGSLDLQSVGVSAKDSRDIIVQLGNALASTGKGKAELEGITTALAQMYGKGKVSAEEINQIAERYPAIRAIAASLDKNSPSKFTQGLSEALSKLPRATGTAKDALDNLGDAWDQLSTGATAGKINNAVKNITQATADAMGGGDFMASLEKGISSTMDDTNPLSKYELSKEEIAKRQAVKKAAAEAEQAEKDKLLKTELDIQEAENKAAHAKSVNDDEMILAANQELAIIKERKKLMESMGISEQQATEFIKKRVALEQEGDNIARNKERSDKQFAASEELKLMEARAGGASDRKLKKMEKGQRMGAEEDKLIKEGMAPAKAKEFARRKIEAEDKIAQDADRAAMGLRPRIRGAGFKDESDNRRAGLDTATYEGLENLASMQPAPSDRRTTKGAGYKEPRQRQDGAKTSSGVGGDIAKLIAATERVEKAVLSIGPTRNDKAKPISTTAR